MLWYAMDFLSSEFSPERSKVMTENWRFQERGNGFRAWKRFADPRDKWNQSRLTRFKVSILGKLASDESWHMFSRMVSRFWNCSRNALSSSEMFSIVVSSRDNSSKVLKLSAYIKTTKQSVNIGKLRSSPYQWQPFQLGFELKCSSTWRERKLRLDHFVAKFSYSHSSNLTEL